MDHYYDTIPGWAAFRALYKQVVRDAPADRPSVFVEIGSWCGKSAVLMGVEIINSGKPIQLHCVDPWIDGGDALRNTPHYKALKKPLYQVFLDSIKPVSAVVSPHKAKSMDALHEFADNSIDFIMIDGDHSYEAVKADIAGWLPKLKPGALMSGDDYLRPGVEKAVREAFGGNFTAHILKENPNNVKKSVSYWTIRLPGGES